MLAGRPHEAAGNGSPRWMTVAPRKRAHRTRPTGRLTPFMSLTWDGVVATLPGSVPVPSEPPRGSRRWPRGRGLRVGEEVPVSIHRLGDSGMTEPGLNHLGVQVGSDQRRGVEVAQVMEPRALRQAVGRVGACLATQTTFGRRCGRLDASAGISDVKREPPGCCQSTLGP